MPAYAEPPEIVISTLDALGIGMLTFVIMVVPNHSNFGLHMFLLTGILLRSVDYLLAPLMAILADHDLKSRHKPTKFAKQIAGSTAVK